MNSAVVFQPVAECCPVAQVQSIDQYLDVMTYRALIVEDKTAHTGVRFKILRKKFCNRACVNCCRRTVNVSLEIGGELDGRQFF